MKKLIVLAALVVAVAGGIAATAEAGSWRPGTPTMVSESEFQDLLEQTYDSAFCQGIARNGKQGEFPYEEYVVFNCSIEQYGSYSCYDVRYQAIKKSRRGWFGSRRLREGKCFYG